MPPIRHENRYYQLLKDNKPLPKPKDKILVRIHLDGRVQLLYREKPLAFRPSTPKQLHQQRSQQTQAAQSSAKPKAAQTPRTPQKRWRPNAHRLATMNEQTS